MNIYLVGGAVRDQLLDLPVQERDWVVVGAKPQQLLDKGFRTVGKDFPVFIHPETGEEYALARTERKTGQGYYGFECYAAPDVSLADDLKRRDLTINAIAQAENGEIIDPYGGQQDLAQRILRHVSPAFVEDPLRVLRVARFAARFTALGFHIADETQALMQTMVADGEIANLVPDRVWQEFEKALQDDQPQVFIQVLQSCGALVVIFPQYKQNSDQLDILQEVVQLSSRKTVRFAALMLALVQDETSIKDICQRYPVPRSYRELAILAMRCRDGCHRGAALSAQACLQLLEQADAFRRSERFADFLLVCQADYYAHHERKSSYPQKEFWQNALACANEVNVQAIIDQGLQGAAIGEEVRRQRLAKMQEVIALNVDRDTQILE